MKHLVISINGKKKLSGTVQISGAKNAALPELAASLLSSEECLYDDIPEVEDVKVMFKSLQHLGAEGEFMANKVRIRIPNIRKNFVPAQITKTSRASILILGPLVARNGTAKVSFPGGCDIGDRKVNFHLDGLRKMGVGIELEDDYIIAKADKLTAIDYTFPAKSVTGTENLLMAATLAEGKTILRNCALEPEITDLIVLLQNMGADIQGKGSETIVISGKTSLSACKHKVIPDRIEMGTYVIAGAFPGNNIQVQNAVPEHIKSLTDILAKIGIRIEIQKDTITVCGDGKIEPADIITEPYPGFPTDLQAQLTTLLTQAHGVSCIIENIFSNRFKHIYELNKLGANIDVYKNRAIVKGKTDLVGKRIKSTDLRASAALVLGGLIANGRTFLENPYQLFRGYQNMPEKLNQLGADISLIEE